MDIKHIKKPEETGAWHALVESVKDPYLLVYSGSGTPIIYSTEIERMIQVACDSGAEIGRAHV